MGRVLVVRDRAEDLRQGYRASARWGPKLGSHGGIDRSPDVD